jgi:enterochelin esterase-like enzyme
MIIDELIPFIDSQYATRADRSGRLLEGFSMGGFGALKFAAKYPERFASVVAYGAPRLVADLGMGGQDADIFKSVFGGDPGQFRRNTPGWLFRTNLGRIQASGLRVRLVAGSDDGTRHSVRKLHDELQALGLAHEFVELPRVRHTPGLYYDADRGAGLDFHAKALEQRR